MDKNKETEHQVLQGFYSSVGRGKNGFWQRQANVQHFTLSAAPKMCHSATETEETNKVELEQSDVEYILGSTEAVEEGMLEKWNEKASKWRNETVA